jgi:hypothetical protein
MLVRSFANDLLNQRMEQFRKERARTAEGRTRRPRHRNARDNEAITPHAGSKSAKVLEMIGRAEGATLAEIMKFTGWKAPSVYVFLSKERKKQNLKITSTRTEVGDRVYQIER